MPNNAAQSIRGALSQHRPAWDRWLASVDSAVKPGVIPRGAEAAKLVREFLQLPADGSPARHVARVCAEFGIDEADAASAKSGAGWAKAVRAERTLFAQEHAFTIAAGSAPAKRRQMVLAHEIGHLFYACLDERARGETLASSRAGVRSQEEERFCWDFALELSCPAKQRLQWTIEFVQSLLTPEEQSLPARLAPFGLDQMTYWHLRRLAARYRLSTRLVIHALDHHSLLDDSATGIAVFRELPNQWTGREACLRLWQHARPSWGHIISNKRASKQGFASARGVYDETADQETVVVSERLDLWRSQENEKSKWKRIATDTQCAYTPVDVKGEGRYLIAMWRWRR
jgi:hypothetical protein